jgi:type IV pilus assembly protein PilM
MLQQWLQKIKKLSETLHRFNAVTGSQVNIGLDIGQHDVKLVCLEKNNDTYTLIAYGKFLKERTQLQELFDQKQMRSGRVRVNIEDPSLKIRRLPIPKVPDKERPEIVKWSLEGIVDGDIQDNVIRYQPLDVVTEEEGKELFIVYAIQKEVIEKRITELKALGIHKPEIIEPSSVSLYLSYINQTKLEENQQDVLIDIGEHHAYFMVMDKDSLFFSRRMIGFSAESLTKTISRNLGVDEEKAELIKSSYVFGDEEGEKSGKDIRLENTISHFATKFSQEIQRSIDLFQTEFPNEAIKGVSFCGEGSRLAGLDKRISEQLNLPHKAYHPFAFMDISLFSAEEIAQDELLFGTACGLAL